MEHFTHGHSEEEGPNVDNEEQFNTDNSVTKIFLVLTIITLLIVIFLAIFIWLSMPSGQNPAAFLFYSPSY